MGWPRPPLVDRPYVSTDRSFADRSRRHDCLQCQRHRNGDCVNSSLALASDFIERAANPAFGLDVNDEYALRWAVMRQTADPIQDLRITELKPEDIEALSPDAWFWLGSSLTVNDPELPIAFVDALFQASADEIYR